MEGDIKGIPQLSNALPTSPTAGSGLEALKELAGKAMNGTPVAGSIEATLRQLYLDAMAGSGTAGSMIETLRKLTAVAVPAMDDATVIYNSLFYRIHELEKHFHGINYIFGWNNATYSSGTGILRHSVWPLNVTAGQDYWGTELQIHGGSVLAGAKFDFNKVSVVEVGTANRPITAQMFYGTKAVAVATTVVVLTDTLTTVGAAPATDTKVMISNIVGITGLSTLTVYYAKNTGANTFQLCLTDSADPAQAVVDIGGVDGSCDYQVLTQSEGWDCLISCAATNADATPYSVTMPRMGSTDFAWIRARTHTGTVLVKYFLEGHSYPA